MTPNEEHILRLNDHIDARVALDSDLNIVVTIRGIGGSEPMPYVDLTFEELQQLEQFVRTHATSTDSR